jgi:V/A-type H+-transporting ATPase subunit A
MAMLQEEASLNEIVQLVGKDSLSAKDQITLEVAKMIREDFLQQNSFVDIDSFSEYDRQGRMMQLILDYDRLCREAAAAGADVNDLFNISARVGIGRAKSVPADEYVQTYEDISRQMEEQIRALAEKGGDEA